MTKKLTHLSEIYDNYDVICSDVWGVLHNGVTAYQDAVIALSAARKAGKTVILITNSPRRKEAVATQLEQLGVSPDAWDQIITSGDMTRKLISQVEKEVFFLGPDRDLALLDGLNVERVAQDDAKAIVCTGFFNDEVEKPEDYKEMLEAFQKRGVPFICANPDLIVERGNRMIPCAGAIAAFYKQLGGDVHVAGKPHPPMYQAALEFAEQHIGDVDFKRIIAIGDGMPTDVRGAIDFGLDLIFIANGIHIGQYSIDHKVDEDMLNAFLAKSGVRPDYWMEWVK